MRSYLLKSMASVVAMLAALAFVAGGAMAEPKISGGAAAGFGQVSWDTGQTGGAANPADGTSFNAQIESNVIISGTNEKMDYYFRIRGRGTVGDTAVKGFSEGTFNDNQLQTVRVRVGWNVSDAFRIETGKLPGIGGTGFADLRPLRAPSGFRHNVNNYAFFDRGAVNLSFKTGAMRVGLAIGAGCEVDCTADAPTGGISADDLASGAASVDVSDLAFSNQQTLLPYFQGTFGPAKVGLRVALSSGEVVGSVEEFDCSATPCTSLGTTQVDASADSTGMVLEVGFNFGAGSVALEYTGTTFGCVDPIGQSGCKEFETTAIAGALTMGGLLVQLTSYTEDDGAPAATTSGVDTTLISASYLIDVGGGQVGPEFATTTVSPQRTGAKEASGTLIRLIMTTGF